MGDILQEKYKLITYEIEELLDKLKQRDDLWIDIGKQLQGNQYSNEKIDDNIKEKVSEEVNKRKEAWDIISDIYNRHKNIYDNMDIETQPCDIDSTKESLENVITEDTKLQRRYNFLEYQVSLKKENIELLFYCVVTLLVCSFLTFMNSFEVIPLVHTLVISFIAIIVYIFYVVKVAVLNRANRNNNYFSKFDFNKPDESEIEKSKLQGQAKDKENNNCITEDSIRPVLELDSTDDTLEDIKTEIVQDDVLDAPKCLGPGR